MSTVTLTRFDEVARAFRHPDLAQSLYDEGAVVMADVLLNLHGEAHRARRRLENRLFRRDVFRYYEREVIPALATRTMAPFVAAGRADLVALGYRITMNLTADFAGLDRVEQTPEETEALLALVMTFSEGATLVHSTRDKEVVRAEVREALRHLDERFLLRSIDRRRALIAECVAGRLPESELPRDVLTVLLRNDDKLALGEDVIRREVAFYLQAGSHSTANSMTHALHDIFTWCAAHREGWSRIGREPFFLQRCVHESMRLHPASPVAWRRAVCPAHAPSGAALAPDDRVVLDLLAANQDPEVFGADAATFNPDRVLAEDVPPFGLTFGTGVHACIGQDLDAGLAPRADTDAAEHLYGSVPVLVKMLLDAGARPDPANPPVADTRTARANWGVYPVLFRGPG